MKWRAYGMICLMALLYGCGQKATEPESMQVGGFYLNRGRAETEFHGIKLIAEGEGPWVGQLTKNPKTGKEGSILKIAGKSIVVEEEQILVDGETKAKIPSGTKSIRALSRNDEVMVEVDGKEVFKLGP